MLYDLCVMLKKLPSEILNEDARHVEELLAVKRAIDEAEQEEKKKSESRKKREKLKQRYAGHSERR